MVLEFQLKLSQVLASSSRVGTAHPTTVVIDQQPSKAE